MQPHHEPALTARDLLSFARPVIGFACVPLVMSQTTAGLLIALIAIAASLAIHFLTTASAARRGTEDDLRVILDSGSESIFHFSIYIALMMTGWFPIWALCICYAGDLLLPYLSVLGRQRGVSIIYRPSLTLRTATHAVVQAALILPRLPANPFDPHMSGGDWLPYLAIGATAAAVIDYSIAILKPHTAPPAPEKAVGID